MLPRAVPAPEAPTPAGPYSQAIVSGPLVFLAGQRPVHPHTGEVPSGFAAQVEQALSNIRMVLESEPYPARTTVGVQLRGVLVELDATAVLSHGAGRAHPHGSRAAPAPGAESGSAEAEGSHVR